MVFTVEEQRFAPPSAERCGRRLRNGGDRAAGPSAAAVASELAGDADQAAGSAATAAAAALRSRCAVRESVHERRLERQQSVQAGGGSTGAAGFLYARYY